MFFVLKFVKLGKFDLNICLDIIFVRDFLFLVSISNNRSKFIYSIPIKMKHEWGVTAKNHREKTSFM